MVTFGVELGGHLQDGSRAELDAEFAALAAIDNEVDLTLGNFDLLDIQRCSPEAHGHIPLGFTDGRGHSLRSAGGQKQNGVLD